MKAVAGPLPVGAAWCYEVKWDGVRALAECRDHTTRLWSASGRDLTGAFPELAGLAGALAVDAVLDGEIVVLDPAGRPDFSLVARRHAATGADAATRAADLPATYLVFDVLEIDGRSTIDLPYARRRDLLEQLVPAGTNWAVPPAGTDGAALLAAADQRGLEGLVAKRADSPYRPGTRSSAWVKVKVRRHQEFVVGGWLPSRRAASGPESRQLGSLLVGVHTDKGFLFAGAVGSGLTEAERRVVSELLTAIEQPTTPFNAPLPQPEARVAHYVEPVLVVEVGYAEWPTDGRLRHPTYLGRRHDKDPTEVRREA